MAGPIIRTYKGGSIIYFEKDRAEDVYVLQSGRVVLTYTAMDTGIEMKEDVRLGEFFGVKSALGHYPREETAQVIGSANVLVFKVAEFEVFVCQRTHLILKMLKVFSSQLRQVHRKVREILGEGDARSSSYELMNVAEVFYKNEFNDQAIYALEKYLYYYPAGSYVGRAKELLNLARKGQPYPISMPELVYQSEPESQRLVIDHGKDESSIAGLYKKGEGMIDAENIAGANSIFQTLLNRSDFKSPEEKTMVENSLFQLGKCFYLQDKYDNASSTLSMYLKKYPTGNKLKHAVYHLAMTYEKKGDNPKASALYAKVATMSPNDNLSTISSSKAQELKG